MSCKLKQAIQIFRIFVNFRRWYWKMHISSLIFFEICRPSTPSRHSSNSLSIPINPSCFPIQFSVRCLDIFSYNIFRPQSRSLQWSLVRVGSGFKMRVQPTEIFGFWLCLIGFISGKAFQSLFLYSPLTHFSVLNRSCHLRHF